MKNLLTQPLLCLFICITTQIQSQDLIQRTVSNQKYQYESQPKNELAKLIESTSTAYAKKHTAANLFTIDKQAANKTQLKPIVSEVVNLELNNQGVENIFNQKPLSLSLQIPVNEESFFTLQLVQVDIKTPGYELRTSEGLTISSTKNEEQLFYRGIIEQDNQSLVAVSINPNGIRVLASDKDGNYVVGQQKNTANKYVMYNDRNLKVKNELSCQTPDEITQGSINIDNSHDGTGAAIESKCIPVYIEVDYTFFTNKNNSVSEVENYITGLFNEVSTIYFNEQISTSISEIFVHTAPDPFRGFPDTHEALRGFINLRQNNFNGRLAHLISGRPLGGGKASLNVLCSINENHAVSQLYGFYNQLPTYSWDLYVFTHEMGHNLGSLHTHNCSWNGNNTAIDGCANRTEGNCPIPALPSNGGTIMSYCHNSTAGINFSLGFGRQPGDVIRNRFNNATCDLACGTTIEINMPMAGNSWQPGSSNNIIWFDNIAENVKIELYRGNNFITSISPSTASDGNFNWTVPNNIVVASDYRIKITSINNNNLSDFSEEFSIAAQGYISVTYPTLNELWQPGSTYTIRWQDNIGENVSITLYQNNNNVTTIASSTPSTGSYTWTVPTILTTGNNFKIRISSITSPNLFDESAFFEIQTPFQPSIEVITPNGNTIWQTGNNYLIQWEKNIPDNLNIELYKGNTLIEVVQSNYSGNGYTFQLSESFQAGTDYRIKLSSSIDNLIFNWSNYFQIEKAIMPGEIVVTAPEANTIFEIEENILLVWESNIEANFKIELYKGNSFVKTVSPNHSGGTAFNYDHRNTLTPGNDYRFKVTALTQQAESDYSDYFEIKSLNNQGEISIINPNNSTIWSSKDLVPITWRSDISGNFTIELYKNNVFVRMINQSSNSPFNFALPTDIEIGDNFQVKVTSNANNSIFAWSDYFKIQDLYISINYPQAGARFQQGENLFASWETNSTSIFAYALFRGDEYVLSGLNNGDPWLNWPIPNNIPDGDNYRLQVSIYGNSIVNDFSDYFSIGGSNTAYTINVTKPAAANTVLYYGDNLEMEWESTAPGPYTIEFYDGDTYVRTLSTGYRDKSLNRVIYFDDFNISNQHRFKISSTPEPSAFGWSEYFSVQNLPNATIVVDFNYDRMFSGGYTYPINYITNVNNNFNFDLYKGNNYVETLYSDTQGFLQGGSKWGINYVTPENPPIVTGTDYRIKITSVVDENLYDFSDYFEYKNVGDYNFNITYPANNTVWQTGQTYTIQWTDDVEELMSIYLYINNTYVWTIDRSVPGTSFQWTVPEGLSAGSNYRIKMLGDNNQTIKDWSDFFTIQNNNMAYVELLSPNLNSEWQAGNTHLIRWTDNLNTGLELQLFKGNALINTFKSNYTGNNYVWILPEELITGGDYRIKATSSFDNSVNSFSNYFKIENFCNNAAQSSNEWIENVSLNHLYNASGNNNGYADFTHLSTDVVAGESYIITLTPGYIGSPYPENWSVWIDLNDDGNFSNEELLLQTTQAIVGAVNGEITIPANANLNTVRMRVAMSWSSQSTDACGTSNMFGEMEDYTLHISDSNCFEVVNLENQPACAGSYQATQYIQTSTPIYAPQNVEYKAGNYVELKGGFEVDKAINFDVRIGSCD